MKSKNEIQINLEDIKSAVFRILSDRRRLGRIILILCILIIALAIRLTNINKAEDQIVLSNEGSADNTLTEMYVDISGEVNKPGVYLVDDGTRLYEVINKAGGLTDNANTDQINQAGYVEDGEKIIIPSIGNEETRQSENDVDNGKNKNENYNENGLININSASKEQLMTITGIGEVIAERIIDYRKTKQFKTIEDIMNIKGIGNATYEKMKLQITV